MSVEDHPISRLQWVPRGQLRANSWNPNRVAPPELALLRLSIVEDGWTQPIVAGADDEIVDGYHRWKLSERPDVAALTDGLVPVVPLEGDGVRRRAATVRHNRARGVHHVLRMADMVVDMAHEFGVDPEAIGRALGMDDEEVDRLLDRGQMTKRGAGDGFGMGWGT